MSNELSAALSWAKLKGKVKQSLGPWGVFLKGFVKHPVMVGSIIPSSNRTIEKMLAPVDWAHTQLFVEYGPGVGTFSRPILDKLPRDGALIVIDTNKDFIDYLGSSIGDSRFHAVHGSAADVEEIIAALGFQQADYILSGLPFSTLPDGLGEQIAAATGRAVRPGGAFLVYQFTAACHSFMAPHFARIDSGFEFWNVLPCKLFWGWKSDKS